jgi:hypothetical protein
MPHACSPSLLLAWFAISAAATTPTIRALSLKVGDHSGSKQLFEFFCLFFVFKKYLCQERDLPVQPGLSRGAE